jgi:hypothetical protein
LFLQPAEFTDTAKQVFSITVGTLLEGVNELRTGMGQAAEMISINKFIIKIYIDIVTVRLKSLELAVPQYGLQRIASPGTVLIQ